MVKEGCPALRALLGDAAAHRREVAQGRGTGGDSGAAGSRGRRGEPRAAAGAAGGGCSRACGAGSGAAARETARGSRERHTPRRAGPHGAASRRPREPRGSGAGQGELGGAGVAHPGGGTGPGGPGAAPVWPRYLPAPRRSPAPSWSGGGSGAARGRPPPATDLQRGRGGEGPGAGGSCSTRGAADWHCDSPRRPGRDCPVAALALFGLPARPRRPRPPAHDRAVPGRAHSGAHRPYGAGGRDASLGAYWLEDRLSAPMRE